MNKSENINELASAFTKMQGEIIDAYKSNDGYNYKYADLSSILEIARPVMSKHGLSFTQFPGSNNNPSEVTIETMIMHSSGQFISKEFSMRVHEGKGMTPAQAAGSVITYARRYALAAAIGITQTDTDARNENFYEKVVPISKNEVELLREKIKKASSEEINICKYFSAVNIESLSFDQFTEAMFRLQVKIDKAKEDSLEGDNIPSAQISLGE